MNSINQIFSNINESVISSPAVMVGPTRVYDCPVDTH
jgi:hypothetical protein